MTDINVEYINLHTNMNCNLDETEEIYSKFTEFEEVELKNPILNRVSDISENKPNECEIAFGKKGEGNPIESDLNYIHIVPHVSEDGSAMINVHADFWHEYDNQVSNILRQIVEILGTVEVDIIATNFTISAGMSELQINGAANLPDSLEYDHEVAGLRIDYFDEYGDNDVETDILLQSIDGSEEDLTSVRIARRFGKMSHSEIGDIVGGQKKEMRGIVMKMVP